MDKIQEEGKIQEGGGGVNAGLSRVVGLKVKSELSQAKLSGSPHLLLSLFQTASPEAKATMMR